MDYMSLDMIDMVLPIISEQTSPRYNWFVGKNFVMTHKIFVYFKKIEGEKDKIKKAEIERD